MILPAFGFLLGLVVFSVAGAVILRLSSGRAPRIRELTIFVVVAFATAISWAFFFGRFVAAKNGNLESTAWVVIFLLGLPVVSALVGWAVARRSNRVV